MSNHLREDRDILHLMERTKKAMAENVTIPRAQHEALEALIAAAKDVVETSDEFRRGMGPEWEGDPLTDAVDKIRAILEAALSGEKDGIGE